MQVVHGRRNWERGRWETERKDWWTEKKKKNKKCGETEKGYGRNNKTRQEGESDRKIQRRRRGGSNGDTGWVRLKVERQDGVRVLSPSSLFLSHPFLRVVLLQCLTEKRRRQICSLQPLLATNEFRLYPNELLAELLLHSYQSKNMQSQISGVQVRP